MVKIELLLCSRSVNVPTLTYKMKLASILSISCNIQHLTQQQRQGKLQWKMLRKRTVCGFQWADMVIGKSGLLHDVIKRMMARTA